MNKSLIKILCISCVCKFNISVLLIVNGAEEMKPVSAFNGTSGIVLGFI